MRERAMGKRFCVSRILASDAVRSAVRGAAFAAAVLSISCAGFAAEVPLDTNMPPAPASAPAPPPAPLPLPVPVTAVPAPAYVVRVQPYSTAPLYVGAPAPPAAGTPAPVPAVPVLVPADAPPPPPIPKPLDGLNFGAGIAVTFGQSRVASATVVNNIVRVTESSDVMAGIVLESHYFFVPKIPFLWGSVDPGSWGHGPFVAVDASTANGSTVIAGFSMGWMVGFRRTRLTPVPFNPAYAMATTDNNSWNIGVGFRVDPRATVLGDGIVANMPLPPGETEARLKTVPRYGVMLLTSFSF
jgi:hypothetical protein